ncbi:MAG: hypothetical protein ACYDFT_02745 [Thermoplasmata archaeon]
MTPPLPPPPALSAPDLIGPISILDQPISGPRSNRRARNRPYSHVHIEIDLSDPSARTDDGSLLERLETLLSERKIVEGSNIVRLAAGTLHALSARRFRWIDHWEIEPGGWLPLPVRGSGAPSSEEPVGHLLVAIESGMWNPAAEALKFSVRISDRRGNHVDAIVRRVHRQRRHALSLDLRGSWTKATVDALTASLASRLPVAHATVTKIQYE